MYLSHFSTGNIWTGLTYDPLLGKLQYQDKRIQPYFRPWCPGTLQQLNDRGSVCIVYSDVERCIRPIICGVPNSVICQNRGLGLDDRLVLSQYVRVAQNALSEIKNDCNSCKKND